MNRRQDKICSPTLLLWTHLNHVSKVSFSASSKLKSASWHREGNGVITSTQEEPDTLIMNEKGRWKDCQERAVNYTNSLKWTLDRAASSLSLEHLHLGRSKPTFLMQFTRTDDRGWRSHTPHLCGKDSYTGKISLNNNSIKLTWIITGPNKDETIEMCYL